MESLGMRLDVRSEVRTLSVALPRVVSFSSRRGEVVGFGGLVGAGRTEVARAIFGADPLDAGEILLERRAVRVHSPRDAIGMGIGLVPEDRKQFGLILGMAVRENV